MRKPVIPCIRICPADGKRVYGRKVATKAARVLHPSDWLVAYRCPHGHGWHIGHARQPLRNPDRNRRCAS